MKAASPRSTVTWACARSPSPTAYMESGQAGRQVTMDEIMADGTNDYQQEINDSLGI